VYPPGGYGPWQGGPYPAPAARPNRTPIFIVVGIVGILAILIGALAITGNLPGASQASPDPGIMAVLRANVDATNNGDIDAYMACLDPSSPVYPTTRSALEALVASYKIHVELNEASIVDQSDTVAHVHVVMTTTKVSGPAFRDNRLTAVMELHKVNGKWLIYGQTISNVEYL
jgi:hypothetical protein